jgi:hypothetical protein
MTPLPPRTRRHFPAGAPDLADPRARGAALARLLEDGDRGDLAWLARVLDRAALADWVGRHGARRLSRRSRALWFAALGLGEAPRRATAEALWPLA